MQRVDKTKILFLLFSSLLVLTVVVWQLGALGNQVQPIASDNCAACHLDAQIITGLYVPPTTVGGGGG